jgi:triosephosphate isomerase
MAKKLLVAGNWKMYVQKIDEAHALALGLRRRARKLSNVELCVAPPFPFIADVAKTLESSPIAVGAQAAAAHEGAAHTGEVSGAMLKSVGASFAIIGHSERRAMGETNDLVRKALEEAIGAGLQAIVCVGEREREAEGEHFSFIEAQLSSAIADLPKNFLRKVVIAYEPVWAIGKSVAEAMTPPELEQMAIFVRKTVADLTDRKTAVRMRVLYGGSVEPGNAGDLLKAGVDGFLVGHASADIESFGGILDACK